MLDGWYCRSIGNNAGAEEEEEEEEEEESQEEVINYKAHYRNLKRKLKFLIYVSFSVLVLWFQKLSVVSRCQYSCNKFNSCIVVGYNFMPGFDPNTCYISFKWAARLYITTEIVVTCNTFTSH